jgi:septum formation protein
MNGPFDELILASNSPRRSHLLQSLGLRFRVVSPQYEENGRRKEESPQEFCVRLSREKAVSVLPQFQTKGMNPFLLAADTIVAAEGEVFGKPRDRAEAREMLLALSGRSHVVCTGMTLLRDDRILSSVEETRVLFRSLTARTVEAYLSSGEWTDKAGAYAAQGLGALFIERLEGDYFNVVGLPLCRLGKMLEALLESDLADLMDVRAAAK